MKSTFMVLFVLLEERVDLLAVWRGEIVGWDRFLLFTQVEEHRAVVVTGLLAFLVVLDL